MSQRRPNLSSPPVVAGVFVVLAVLIAVNVRTFAPRRHGGRAPSEADVRVQAHPALPMDLEEVLAKAGQSTARLGEPLAGPRPHVARDPFGTGAVVPVAVEPGGPAVAAPAPRPAGPVCTAVMLGGGSPLALIDGRLCRVGDHVRQYTVDRIDARGVSLGGDRKLFLPVGLASAGEGVHVVVTGVATGDRAGRTSLVEHAESESK